MTYPEGEGPVSPDDAKAAVEELFGSHTTPIGPEPREDNLDDPAHNASEEQEEPMSIEREPEPTPEPEVTTTTTTETTVEPADEGEEDTEAEEKE